MTATFSVEGAVGFITLDNPPANAYDLSVMRACCAGDEQATAPREGYSAASCGAARTPRHNARTRL